MTYDFVGVVEVNIDLDSEEFAGLTEAEVVATITEILACECPGAQFDEDRILEVASDFVTLEEDDE